MSEEGQQQLLKKIDEQKSNPGALSMLSYANPRLMSMGEGEWVEIELTADTGACDSVMRRTLCPNIPIVPSP